MTISRTGPVTTMSSRSSRRKGKAPSLKRSWRFRLPISWRCAWGRKGWMTASSVRRRALRWTKTATCTSPIPTTIRSRSSTRRESSSRAGAASRPPRKGTSTILAVWRSGRTTRCMSRTAATIVCRNSISKATSCRRGGSSGLPGAAPTWANSTCPGGWRRIKRATCTCPIPATPASRNSRRTGRRF